MKNAYRKLVVFPVLVGAVTCVSSCIRRGEDEKIDSSKTQLFIANMNGGYGYQWLEAAKQRFETKFADYAGENGKKGVQIIVDNSKENGTYVLDTMSSSRDEIYFSENIYYNDFVSSGKVLDITDIVTEKLTEYGESKSIADKLTKQQKDYFEVNGKYYGLPHYEGIYGIVYDVDLFDENSLYFSVNKDNGNEGFVVSKDDTKSTGPDGISGTYDDGLPATYDDFYALCNRMTTLGIKPISWTGQYQKYVTNLCTALQVSAEGLDQMMLNWTLDGEATNLVSSIDETTGQVTLSEPTRITNSNGYLLSKQAGKYYALKFIEQIIQNNWYYDLSFNNSQSHIGAQEDFLYGRFSSKKDTIGMLIEGSWWENEADGIFSDMSVKYSENKAGRHARRFGYLPLPKAPGQELGKATYIDYLLSAAFINSNIASNKIDLAKKFLQFVNTDESLIEFTKITSATKALQYEIPEADMSSLSYFAKNLINIKKTSEIVYPVSSNKLVNSSFSSFASENMWYSTVSGNNYNVVSTALRNQGISALSYFYGLSDYNNKSSWESSYSRYF